MDSFFLSSSFFRNCMRIVSFGRIIAAVLLSSIPGQFNCPLSPVAIPLFRYTAIPSPVKLEVAICDIQHLFHFGTSARVCKEFLLTTISNSDLFLRSQIATIKSFFPFSRLPVGSHRPLSRMSCRFFLLLNPNSTLFDRQSANKFAYIRKKLYL